MQEIKLKDGFETRITKEYFELLKDAQAVAQCYSVRFIGTEFILIAMLKSELQCGRLLRRYGVTKQAFETAVKNDFAPSDAIGFTSNTRAVMNFSVEIAEELHADKAEPEHLLLAVLTTANCAGNIYLRRVCPYYTNLVSAVRSLVETFDKRKTFREESPENKIVFYDEDKSGEIKVEPFLSIEGTILEKFGYDMTEKARKGKIEPVIGRVAETDAIINTLSRRMKSNPIVIGEPGTGKSAVVGGLAVKMATGEVPFQLKNKILYSLDIARVVAGAKFRGEFEQRFKDIIDFVEQSGNVILFIDEIHMLVSGAKSDGVDASDILKPALARGELQLIGATTTDEYKKYFETDKAFQRRFYPIKLDPPSVEDSVLILKGLRSTFESHHRVEITDEAIEAAVKLSDRYITDRFLPDKAIDLIDEAAARARIFADSVDTTLKAKNAEKSKIIKEIEYARARGNDCSTLYSRYDALEDEIKALLSKATLVSGNRPFVSADDVAKVISEYTGIPLTRLTEKQAQRVKNLEQILKKRVVGQDGAVSAVCHAVKRAMTGIKDPNKPIGTFLFVGPTGVGKTELTKALAEALFGDEDMLVRIDMSEYMEKNSVSKLIGTAPGYVGYEDDGQLSEKVRRKPYSVVLFDEIEKADPEVFNLFLQIFDEGRLTDGKGVYVDFKNTVIIMTSNVGATASATDAAMPKSERINAALRKHFKPEFLNRIDDIVTFNNLTRKDCFGICRILIEKFAKRLFEQNITFTFDDGLVEILLNEGYSEEYGARQLRRAVTDILEDAVSEKILDGSIKPYSKVKATAVDGFIDFIII